MVSEEEDDARQARRLAVSIAADKIDVNEWHRSLIPRSELIANYILDGTTRDKDTCLFCHTPMDSHTIRTENIVVNGRAAVLPVGYNCPINEEVNSD